MENEKDTVLSVQNEALGAAAEHIRGQRKARADLRVLAYCLTALLCVALVCGTVWGCYSMVDSVAKVKMLLEMYKK